MTIQLESDGVYVIQAVMYGEQITIGVATTLPKAMALVEDYRSRNEERPANGFQELVWETKPNWCWYALTWRRSNNPRTIMAYDIQFMPLNALILSVKHGGAS
jgi:hypothetical protein